MSWSYSVVGKPAALIKRAQEARDVNKCVEPEETIRQAAFDIIEKSLGAMPETYAVEINASGSQSKPKHDVAEFVNNFTMTIRPLWGFIE